MRLVSRRLSAGTGGGAARQSAELIEMDWLRALRDQVCVEEVLVSELILGIVMDVLVHVPIQDFQGFGVDWIPVPPGTSLSWMPAELVVLHPEIGLEDFRRRREPEQGGIAGCESGSRSRPHRQTLLRAELNSAAPGASAAAPSPMRRRKDRRGRVRGAGERLVT